jgi:hypothetical protein
MEIACANEVPVGPIELLLSQKKVDLFKIQTLISCRMENDQMENITTDARLDDRDKDPEVQKAAEGQRNRVVRSTRSAALLESH